MINIIVGSDFEKIVKCEKCGARASFTTEINYGFFRNIINHNNISSWFPIGRGWYVCECGTKLSENLTLMNY